jgi:hypothetical protein
MRYLIEPRALVIRGRCHLARSLTRSRGSTAGHAHNYTRTDDEGDATTNEYTSSGLIQSSGEWLSAGI